MTLAAAIALLQAAFSLLTFVSAHPELGFSAREQAISVSQQAIQVATLALQTSSTGAQSQTSAGTQAASSCPVVSKPSCTVSVPIVSNGCTIGYQCSAEQTQAGTQAQTTSQGSSCTTPWGSKTISHGESISSQPYFSRGMHSGTVVVPIMRCQNGAWLQCDWQGNNCQLFTGTSLF